MLDISLADNAVQISAALLFVLGAVVGLLGGFFGVGGGWIVTPALNVLGMPIPYAVGTGLAYIFGMSSVSAWRHRRWGKIEPGLALVIGGAMVVGVKLGEKAVMLLDERGEADSVVRILYIVFLVGLGLYMLVDGLRDRIRGGEHAKDSAPRRDALFQRCLVPPVLHLPRSGIRLSVWPLLGVGVGTGFLSGMLGAGGGFVLMPVMVYLVGMQTVAAVGTSLVCLVLASPFGVLAYGLEGRVEFVAALIMIAGALVGAPLGVRASHIVKGAALRLLYSVMIIVGGASVLLKQLGSRTGGAAFDVAARVVILSAAGGMALLILVLMLAAIIRRERAPAE